MGSSTNLSPQKRPPLRKELWTPDPGTDQARIDYCWQMWHSQDLLFLRRDRQIEENIRMLAGQQWAMYSKLMGRFVDISHFFTDRERKWRQRPVFNQLLRWFMLMHARMTENPPVITFQPGSGDAEDSDLAEVMDTIFKILWKDVGMLEVIDRIVAWLAPSGEVYWKTIVDPNIGDIIEWGGPATLSMEGGDGQLISRDIEEDVPFNDKGEPMGALVGDGTEWEATGKAFREYEGGLQVEVLAALQVRGQWGNAIPWHRKRWHAVRTFVTPEEIYDRTGQEVQPDADSTAYDQAHDLRRVLFGSGFFGAIENLEEGLTSHYRDGASGYVDTLELWEAPCTFEGMQRGKDEYEEPGGRVMWVTRDKCLRDGQRPAPYAYTSPIRHLSFVNLPGRPSGSTPQEAMNPQQRAYNRRWAQLIEHDDLSCNPIGIVDKSQGMDTDSVSDEPGQMIAANRKSGNAAPPLEYVTPPALGPDVWRTVEAIRREIQDAGNLEGNEGRAPTRDASGELVKELRFNEDRYISPTSRRLSLEMGRMVEDWIVTIPYFWTEENTLSWAGDDQILRTVLVTPDLFEKGKVNVTPDIESMLPEGRGERQAKHRQNWIEGAYGDPQSDAAITKFLELARFPHMGRAMRPGGVDRIMAETENGRLAQGIQATGTDIPIFPWQDHAIHMQVHEEFMKGPDYQKLDVAIQQQFVTHWMMTQQAAIQAMQLELEQEKQRRIIADTAVAEVEAARTPPAGAGGPELPEDVESPEGAPAGEATPDTAVA